MFHSSDKCPFVYEKFESFGPKIKQKYSNPKTCMEVSQLTSFVITVEKGMEEEMEKSVVEGFGGNEVELVKVVERVEKFAFEKGKEKREGMREGWEEDLLLKLCLSTQIILTSFNVANIL